MGLLLTSLFLLLAATVVRVLHGRSIRAATLAQRTRLKADLERVTGIRPVGDILDSFQMRGTYDGGEVLLRNNGQRKLPGPSSEQRTCGLVKFNAAIPDLIVCSTTDADAVMGPIPSVARTPTGSVQFDSMYSVFVAPQTSDAGTSFRRDPISAVLSWAKPEVLQQCVAEGVKWFRVHGGNCELALPPTGPKRAHIALALSANLRRAAAAQPILALPAPLSAERRVPELTPLYLVLVVTSSVGAFLAMPFACTVLPSDGPEIPLAMLLGFAVLYTLWVTVSLARWARWDAHKNLQSES